MAVNVIREQVFHRQFGTGTIINQTAGTIEVEFGKEYSSRKFIYPSVFENFLVLSNSEMQSQMDKKLRKIRVQEKAKKALHELEVQKQHEEERQSLLACKRAAAGKKRVSAKKSTV